MRIGRIGDILPFKKFCSKKNPVRRPMVPLAITSIANITLSENVPLTHTLIANKTVTWTKVGGLDQSLFSISGNVLNMSAKDFESPTDSDTNNSYVVVIRATDSSGSFIDQSIVVTVTNLVEGTGLDNNLAPLRILLDPSSPANGSAPKLIIYTNSTDHDVGDTIRLYARDKTGSLLGTYTNQITLIEATDTSGGTEGKADFGLAALGAGTRRWTGDVLKADGRWTPLSNTVITGPEDQEPIITNASSAQNGATSGKVTFTTDTAEGTAAIVFTTTNSPPSNTTFNASTFTLNITSVGTKEIIGTGLSASTLYYAWVRHIDAVGNASAITAAGSFNTLASGSSVAKLVIGQGDTNAGPTRSKYVDVAANGLDWSINNQVGGTCGVISLDPPPEAMHFELTIIAVPEDVFYLGVTDASVEFGPALYPNVGINAPGFTYRGSGGNRQINIHGNSELYTSQTQLVGDVYAWDIHRVNLTATLRKLSGGTTTTILNALPLTTLLPTNWRVFVAGHNSPQAGRVNFGATAFAIQPLAGHTGW